MSSSAVVGISQKNGNEGLSHRLNPPPAASSLSAPTLRTILQHLKVDPDWLTPRQHSTLAQQDDDSGSPTPLARELVPLIEVLSIPSCQNLQDYDALVEEAGRQRETVRLADFIHVCHVAYPPSHSLVSTFRHLAQVKERLDKFEAAVRDLRHRDSAAENAVLTVSRPLLLVELLAFPAAGYLLFLILSSLALSPHLHHPSQYHEKRRTLRSQLDQLLEEQRRQLRALEELSPNMTASALPEVRQRDLQLRDMCARIADCKRQCIRDIHRAMVEIMGGQQQLRDVSTQHTSAGKTCACPLPLPFFSCLSKPTKASFNCPSLRNRVEDAGQNAQESAAHRAGSAQPHPGAARSPAPSAVPQPIQRCT